MMRIGPFGMDRGVSHEWSFSLAGKKRPSFLKRQKEQQRLAKAVRKREERQARRQGKTTETAGMEEAVVPSNPMNEEPEADS
jgi:hypothetical protein